MTSIIQKLPKEIQEYIFEFNVNHRPLLRKCHKEFFDIIYNNCLHCLKPITSDRFLSIDYFIYKKYKLLCNWCDPICFVEYNDNELKKRYLRSIQEYVLKNSVQYFDIELDEYEQSVLNN